MKVKLLKQIQRIILRKPDRFEMGDWFMANGTNECDTTACIAGWATALSQKKENRLLDYVHPGFDSYELQIKSFAEHPSVVGRKALGLDDEQANRLFYQGEWPEKYSLAYSNANTAKMQARVTAERIQFFIDSKGTDSPAVAAVAARARARLAKARKARRDKAKAVVAKAVAKIEAAKQPASTFGWAAQQEPEPVMRIPIRIQ